MLGLLQWKDEGKQVVLDTPYLVIFTLLRNNKIDLWKGL